MGEKAKRFLDKKSFGERKLKTEEIYFEDLDAWVRIRELNATERVMLELRVNAEENEETRTQALLQGVVALSIIDENNNRMFDLSYMKKIADMPASFAYRIGEAGMRLSGLSQDNIDEAKKN